MLAAGPWARGEFPDYRSSPTVASMIGRDAELDLLVRALGRARSGHGSVALIGGEAGIGKTTLAHELRESAEAQGVTTLWGRTSEAPWAGPYAPWIEALEGIEPKADRLFAVDASLDPEDRRAAIHERVLRTLGTRLDRGAAVLVLEDLHWAQLPALELLRHVAFALASAPLLIAATYRASAAAPHLPLGTSLGHLRREAEVLDIELTGLDRGQLAALLGPASPRDLDRILAETNGNPLFAIELSKSARTLPSSSPDHGTDTAGVPLAVSQAISQRLQSLSDVARAVLLTGSLFADGFDLRTVAILTGIPESEAIGGVDEATVAGFLQAGIGLDAFAFTHAIVRHAILSFWQPSRLIRERRRAAEQLASEPRTDRQGEIAALYHASRALPGAAEGIPYALEAAERARATASRVQVAEFLGMARELASEDDPRLESILRELAVAQAEALRIDDAIATGWRAIDVMDAATVAPNDIAEFAAGIAVALKHRAGALPEQWQPFVAFGLQRVQPERGLGWARLSFVLDPIEPVSRSGIRAGIWTGFDQEAATIARASGTEEDQARSFESFDVRTRAETDALLGRARGFRNPYARLHALTVAGNDLQYRHGAFRDAVQIWNEVHSLAHQHGAVAWQAQALNQRALLEVAFGELDRAAVTEDAANEMLMRLGPGRRGELLSREMETARAIYLGGDWAELGRYWSALADAPTIHAHDVASLFGPHFAALGAYLYALGGEPERASALLDRLVSILQQLPVDASNLNGAAAFAASAAWQIDASQHAPALRYLITQMLDAGWGDYPQTSLLLSLARMDGLLGRFAESLAGLETARDELQQAHQQPLAALTLLDQATVLLKLEPPRGLEAAERAARATELLETLAMPVWAERAREIERIATERALPPLYPAGLSEREVDVLRLAVQGYSDREIADRLFISPRTVNAHMRNMFTKSACANRTELSVWAIEQGIATR